ncbi:MAG: adenosylcobinamide-phosphate synthase CbiB [Polaromonas sp.]|nr:adenosylcobinamide-phosphate synthase CbiB [Polaromonas sp.]MDP3750458.1 adenosylcobinamide-phosphate synthase CbiB [Polaromonas sp.]
MALLAALLLALLIDRLWGEPPAAIHPVVAMGFYLKVAGQRLPGLPAVAAFGAGMLVWCLGMLATGWLAGWLQALALTQLPEFLSALALAVLLKPMFSWRMLHDEVRAVEAALENSLSAGRERLSWLVSRDTTYLSESEVRESAIESLAENLNDSVVAPIFWFVLFGLPGAAIYRFANTADAMWGYRGRWEWAGKWAAYADDVLSWLPARLTALLIWAVTRNFCLANLRSEARRTPSPNSGWPMAAMALALGVYLRKPGVYALNAGRRAPEATDTPLALAVSLKVVVALAVLASTAIVLIANGGGA